MIQIRFDGRSLRSFLSARLTGLPCSRERNPQFAAVCGRRHSLNKRRPSQGSAYGSVRSTPWVVAGRRPAVMTVSFGYDATRAIPAGHAGHEVAYRSVQRSCMFHRWSFSAAEWEVSCDGGLRGWRAGGAFGRARTRGSRGDGWAGPRVRGRSSTRRRSGGYGPGGSLSRGDSSGRSISRWSGERRSRPGIGRRPRGTTAASRSRRSPGRCWPGSGCVPCVCRRG